MMAKAKKLLKSVSGAAFSPDEAPPPEKEPLRCQNCNAVQTAHTCGHCGSQMQL